MITLTFAGDESGDVSFAFDKGASRYFVVAAIGTTDPEGLRTALADLREQLELPAHYEFGFNAMASSRKLRQKIFARLAQLKFDAWAVVTDKTTLPDTFKVMRRLDFYLYFVTELIQIIPGEKRDGATLILDEFGAAGTLPVELRRFMNARGIPLRFDRVLAKRSKSEPLIQIADLVAGAILRRDSHGEPETYEAVESKLRRVLEFNG